MTLARIDFLKTVLSQPSAPFREGHVLSVIRHELRRESVPHFVDPIGNIVVGVSSRSEYLQLVRERSSEPLRVFIAHTDHPGFHGTRWLRPDRLEIRWHGGSPVERLENAPVWLADRMGWYAEGHLTEARLKPSGRAIDTAVVEIPAVDHRQGDVEAERLFGGFRFRAPFWQEGELIYTKAADDLVGSFAIASLAMDLLGERPNGTPPRSPKRGRRRPPPFLGLLTRAEEVGFIGAIGHFELSWLRAARRPVLCVSLETSRALPGAEIGKGPVVRLGDRFTVFHAPSLRVFAQIAQEVLPDRHQKRVMDGGTCEGTTAMVYGFPTVGISVPLGNYHNQSFEGGPDSAGPNGPAPEFVHLSDVEGLLELCRGLMRPKLPWGAPWRAKHQEFLKELRAYRPLLRSGP